MNKNEVYHLVTDMLVEELGTIENRVAEGCRCMSCWRMELRNLDDEVIAYGETLTELCKSYKKYLLENKIERKYR